MIPRLAVAGIAFDARGRVLLAKRGQAPRKGLWSVPGGKVQFGETLAEACKREMREETGLEVDVGRRVTVLERICREGNDVTHHFVIIDFLVYVLGGEPRAASDVDDVGWFEMAHLAELPTTEGLSDVLDAAQVLSGSS